jgi:hypothetical protein
LLSVTGLTMTHIVLSAGVLTVPALLIRRESRILQGYESKANAEKDIEAIKTHAPGATVVDETG